jgi:hypothetical protein
VGDRRYRGWKRTHPNPSARMRPSGSGSGFALRTPGCFRPFCPIPTHADCPLKPKQEGGSVGRRMGQVWDPHRGVKKKVALARLISFCGSHARNGKEALV